MAQFSRVLLRHWRIFAASVALVVAGAYAATLAVTPVYAAEVKLFVSADSSEPGLGDAYAVSQYVAAQVQSIAILATTPRVTQPVATALGLGGADSVGKKITAVVPQGTVFVNVTVKDTDPAVARDIANGVAEQLPNAVADLEAKSPLRVTVVEQAVKPAGPVSPHLRTNLVLGALLGVALGIFLALFRERTKQQEVVAPRLAPAPVRPRVHRRGDGDEVGRSRLEADLS